MTSGFGGDHAGDDEGSRHALRRSLLLTQVHDWCRERLVLLAGQDQKPSVQALRAEYLELLEVIDQRQMLWMRIDHDG